MSSTITRVTIVSCRKAKGHMAKCYQCKNAGLLFAVRTIVEGEPTVGPFGKEFYGDQPIVKTGFHFYFLCQQCLGNLQREAARLRKIELAEAGKYRDYLRERADARRKEREAKAVALSGITGVRGS